jgi:hypothetical protein
MPNNPISAPVPETGPSTTETSARQFDNQATFETHVLSSLHGVQSYHDFVFTDVPSPWGEAVFRIIDENIPARKTHDTKNRTLRIKVMPTWIHDCVQRWMVKQASDWRLNQIITRAEYDLLDVGAGTSKLPYN